MTPSSLEKCRAPLRLFCQDWNSARNVKLAHVTAIFAPASGPIYVKILQTIHNLMLNIVYFMLSPSKVQGEAINSQKTPFWALCARLRALRARDHAAELVVPAFRTDGPSVRVSSLWDNSFYHFLGAPFLNGGDPPVLFPLRTCLKKGTSSFRSEVNKN